MNRRSFLKLLSLGVIGQELDIDRLLWVPGQKKIFLPSTGISLSQIVELEMERILPKIRTLFERDDIFYAALDKRRVPMISSRPMRIPLQLDDDCEDEV